VSIPVLVEGDAGIAESALVAELAVRFARSLTADVCRQREH
jgi:hypothetical protein